MKKQTKNQPTTTTTQSRDIVLVIERNPHKKGEHVIQREDLIKTLGECSSTTSKNPFKYWGVLHDKDVLEDGTIKRPHYHVVLRLEKKAMPSGIAKEIARALGSNDINRFGYQRCENRTGMVRYLMHLDDPHKTRYQREDVFTNDETELTACINAVSANDLNAESLIDATDKARNHRELLRAIGLGNYIQVKGVISDIWEERQQQEDKDLLLAEKKTAERKFQAVTMMVKTLQRKVDNQTVTLEDLNEFLMLFSKLERKGVDDYDD